MIYAKLETFLLCYDWESVARSWTNRSETVRQREKWSIFAAAEKKVVSRCPFAAGVGDEAAYAGDGGES